MSQQVRHNRSKWKWDRMAEYKHFRMMYIHAWRKKKFVHTKNVPDSIHGELESLENVLTYDDIITFRLLAEASHKLNFAIPGADMGAGGGWFSWAWGSKPEENKPIGTFTQEQWKKLYQEIDFMEESDKNDKAKKIPEEYVHTNAKLQLESVSLSFFIQTLPNSSSAPVKYSKLMDVGFNGIHVNFSKRPTSFAVTSSITSATLNDFITLPVNEGAIEMISFNPNQTTKTSGSNSFLEVEFEQNPLDKSSDIRLIVRALQSLNITFSRTIIDHVSKFFSHGGSAVQLKQVANENWVAVRKNAALQLQSALDHHKRIDLRVDVVAPNIIIPSSFLEENAPVLIIELGTLSFHSKLKEGIHSNSNTNNIALSSDHLNEDDFYDHFDLRLSDISASVFLRNQNLYELDKKQAEILSNFDISLSVGVCIINDPNLSKLSFKADFPSFLALISPDKLKKLMSVVKVFSTNTINKSSSLSNEENKSLDNNGNNNNNQLKLPSSASQNNINQINKKQSKSSLELPQANNNNNENIKKKQIKATFHFGEVSALFHADKEKDIIFISIQNFQLRATKTTHDFTADLRLNTFFIEDKIQTKEQFKYIISSTSFAHDIGEHHDDDDNKEDDLVSISFKNIPKDSPAFKIVENIIQLSFNRLDVTVNRETLVQVLHFSKECSAIFENENNNDKEDSIIDDSSLSDNNKKQQQHQQQLQQILSNENNVDDDPDNNKQENKSILAKKNKVTVLFKSETSVSKVSLNLLVDGEKFVYSALEGFSVNVQAYSNKEFKISGTVGKISVNDLSKDTLWREIVRIDDEKVFDFWFETINPIKDSDTGKIIITVEMSSIVCVYLTRFFRRIGNYFNEFSQMQKILQATANKAKERAQQQANEITKVIILDIKIANPKFIVPKASESNEFILANLGDISINNEIIPKENSELLDCIKVSISSISLLTASYLPSSPNDLIQQAVIPNSALKFTIHRPLTSTLKESFPNLSIRVQIPDITMTVTEDQIHLFFGILYGNLAEVPKSTSKAIQAKLEHEITNAAEDFANKHHSLSLEKKESSNLDDDEIQENNDPNQNLKVAKPSLELYVHLQQISLEVFENDSSNPNGNNNIKPGNKHNNHHHHHYGSSLGCFSISSLIVDMKTKDDSSQNISVDIKQISLTDTRNTLSVHKDILIPIHDSNYKEQQKNRKKDSIQLEKKNEQPEHSNSKQQTSSSLWNINYSRSKDGHQTIEMLVHSPRVLLVPDFIWTLNKFYKRVMTAADELKKLTMPPPSMDPENPPITPPTTSIKKLEDNHDTSTNEDSDDKKSRRKQAVNKIKQAVGIIVKVDILSPELCLIEDATDPKSRALVMKESFFVQFSMLEGRQHAQVSISDIQIYKTKLGLDSESLVTILTPFSILLNYSNSPGVLLSVVLEIDPIHIALAYTDVRLALNIRDAWTKVMQDDNKSKQQHEKQLKKENEEKLLELKHQKLRNSKSIEIEEEKEEKETKNEKPEEDDNLEQHKSPKGEEHAKLLWSKISIVLLNDYSASVEEESSVTQLPLLAIMFDEMTATVSNWTSPSMTGTLGLNQFRTFYFNNQLNTFEPMIEPWDCFANIGKQDDFQIKLGADVPLQMNITKKFVETLTLSLEQWESDYKEQQQKKKESSSSSSENQESSSSSDHKIKLEHPFYIENNTGLPLSYWMTNSNSKYRVENATRLPMILPHLEAENRNRFSINLQAGELKSDKLVPMLSIQMQDYNIVPLHNLLFHKQVTYLFQDISSKNKNLRILYSVKNEHGSKIISIGSDIFIFNDTVVPLQILIESPSTQSPVYLDPIAPGQKMCVPVCYSSDSKIKIRPYEFAYDWSNEFIKCSSLMNEKFNPFFTCSTKDRKLKESPHWLYAVKKKSKANNHQRSSRLGMSFDDDQQIEICFYAPFKIENTLPCKVSYMVKTPEGSNLTSGTLSIGKTAEIHQVLTDHRPILHIRIPEFGWSEGIKIGGQTSKRHSLRLYNKQGEGVKIHIQAEQNPFGARSCTLYSNYWIINQTGTKLYYTEPAGRSKQSNILKSESSIVSTKDFEIFQNLTSNNLYQSENHDHLIEEGESIFAKPVIFSEKQFIMRSNHTVWSDSVFLQQSGGVVNLPEKRSSIIGSGTPAACQYGILVKSAPGKYFRTSIVYVRPYCILINKFSYSISVQQHNIPSSCVDIAPGAQVCFHWFDYKAPHHLVIKLEDQDQFSSPFFMDAAASFQLPLYIQQNPEESPPKLRIKINASLSSIITTFWDTELDEPDYIINNLSSFQLLIGQDGTNESIIIQPLSKVSYCWCTPLATKRKLRVAVSHSKIFLCVNLDKLRSFEPIQWKGGDGKMNYLELEISADGLSKILNIYDENSSSMPLKELEKYSLKLSSNNTLISSSTSSLTSSKKDKILVPKTAIKSSSSTSSSSSNNEILNPSYTIGLDLSSIQISLIDEKPQELILISIEGLQVLYCIGNENHSFQGQISELQIDNQLFSTMFPILLHSKSRGPNQPFFQVSILKSTRYSHLRYIPYFALKFQEMDVKIDEVCLLRLLSFIESITSFTSTRKLIEEEKQIFLHSPTFEVDTKSFEPHSGTALFFELLHINPIRINLSFCTTGASVVDLHQQQQQQQQSMLEKSLRAGGFLANIDGAPLRLNGLILENPMCTQEELVSRITKHYTLQLMSETYKILGSIDILGSPVSLVTNLGTGVYDFFHEPVEGTVSNPREFAAGLARGTESLVKNSVFGIFNSASKISGSISKAATTISLDSEWQQSRAKKFRNKPADVTEGISSGIKRLGAGVFDGVTGVISQPIKGLSNDGGSGFVSGVGKGISGLFLRPVVGVVDLITDTSEGIKNAAVYAQYVKERKRAPRFIGKNRILISFDIERSTLQFLLRTIDDCRFEHHFFINSWSITSNSFILLSDRRLFSFTKASPTPKKNWSVPIAELQDINMIDSGVNLLLKNGKTFSFECGKQNADSIKSSVWKLMVRQKSSAIKQLEYHLVEDKSLIKKEVKETLEPSATDSFVYSSPEFTQNSPIPNHLRKSNQLSSSSSTVSSSNNNLPSHESNTSEKTPLLNNPAKNGKPQPQRKQQKQEEDCCSCQIL